MSSLGNVEKLKLEKLLEMGGGYVLDFTNASFASFVRGSVGIDIYDSKYAVEGDSKAKRLRAFWDIEADQRVGKLLVDLTDYWEASNTINEKEVPAGRRKLYEDCRDIAYHLLGKQKPQPATEDEFLKREFASVSLRSINLEGAMTEILEQRLKEIEKCLAAKAPLAVIFMAGSTLEGLLLCIASRDPKKFNQAAASPKDHSGRVRSLPDWKLKDLIDASCEIGLLGLDIKKFSHALRDFRNYIHPYHQMSSGFSPDNHTAQICWQVLKAAIADLSRYKVMA